ncbi:hypothetical protein PTSG_06657 [Salpingoeca rosetta]|uniref:ditrans,polycis-polyprenyl diphosphate synthase [(2E,6E)-farnesyldiphosphate specific] n=1 Tax=Salpingoeca rosetta (strain ATCC 50818 / BSB-021) TaxID=946362 RepID=F2UFM0_SALR5|nr:uncharacterized protein PTSG_06657 [Salpingoeca rosetta]EGD75588.1 hypothetical protein PTSG_06657 [Salpingoeca rosetta]|eukprot:XP_004992045.1 hypothetical protein PTSG_06657 [Salpingoeca rosetta]
MLYGMLHAVLCFVLWLSTTLQGLWRSVRELYMLPLAFSGLSVRQIQQRARRWQKIPAHICLAVTDGPVTYEPLARLVMWCMASGVKHITIWDNQGLCKGSSSLLRQYLQKAHVAYFGSSCASHPLVFDEAILAASQKRPCASTTPEEEGCKGADVQSGTGTRIHFCDDDEGRPAIVKAVQEAARLQRNVDVAWLDAKLTATVPELDLVLMFSREPVLHGLLPWHMRVAEILFCGPHRHVTARTFIRAMNSFSRCEQRFGR